MISVENLTKRYGIESVLTEVSLDLCPHEILAVVGPSGCSKTTLLRLIAGLEDPDAGRISIDGVEVSSVAESVAPHRRKLSLVFQDLALWPHMTAKQHLEFILKRDSLSRSDMASEIDRLLKSVNLNGHSRRYPHQLSGGERQRLAIVRAIASKPSYLLMDEPFSNIDSILKEELQELVLMLSNTLRIGIFYVTHQIEDVHVLADRIAIMNRGRLEQIGAKYEVLSAPENGFVRRLLRLS